jgi:hypothetical protein
MSNNLKRSIMVLKDILHLKLHSTNDEVKTALLNVCTQNKKLTKFINKFFDKYDEYEICAYEDYGWEWDIECYGKYGGAEIAICNHDFRDDKNFDGDGWELLNVPEMFSNYFSDFNWDDITLDNGKYLLLTYDEYFSFQIVDKDNMEDGKVDFYGITWE